MADVIVFDSQVVAAEHDPHPRAIVDQVVRGPVADAVQGDSHALFVKHADVMDVVVVRVILGGRQRLAVAAGNRDAVAAGFVDIAARDAVVGAAVDGHSRTIVVADVADGTAGDSAVAGVPQHNRRAFATFERQAAEGDVRGFRAQFEDRPHRRNVNHRELRLTPIRTIGA